MLRRAIPRLSSSSSSSSFILRRPHLATAKTTSTTTTTFFSSSRNGIITAITTTTAAIAASPRRTFADMNRSGSGGGPTSDYNASRREQEAFLSQNCPLEALGLVEGESSLRNIEKAYESQRQAHRGNKVMLEKLDRAFNCLTDPKSPYYERVTWQQGHRHKLMVELLPPTQRTQAKAYMYFWGTIGIFTGIALIYAFLHPIFKIWRAATR